jgi:hypothetical protein
MLIYLSIHIYQSNCTTANPTDYYIQINLNVNAAQKCMLIVSKDMVYF